MLRMMSLILRVFSLGTPVLNWSTLLALILLFANVCWAAPAERMRVKRHVRLMTAPMLPKGMRSQSVPLSVLPTNSMPSPQTQFSAPHVISNTFDETSQTPTFYNPFDRSQTPDTHLHLQSSSLLPTSLPPSFSSNLSPSSSNFPSNHVDEFSNGNDLTNDVVDTPPSRPRTPPKIVQTIAPTQLSQTEQNQQVLSQQPPQLNHSRQESQQLFKSNRTHVGYEHEQQKTANEASLAIPIEQRLVLAPVHENPIVGDLQELKQKNVQPEGPPQVLTFSSSTTEVPTTILTSSLTSIQSESVASTTSSNDVTNNAVTAEYGLQPKPLIAQRVSLSSMATQQITTSTSLSPISTTTVPSNIIERNSFDSKIKTEPEFESTSKSLSKSELPEPVPTTPEVEPLDEEQALIADPATLKENSQPTFDESLIVDGASSGLAVVETPSNEDENVSSTNGEHNEQPAFPIHLAASPKLPPRNPATPRPPTRALSIALNLKAAQMELIRQMFEDVYVDADHTNGDHMIN